jgi:hypothetical protein
MSVLNSCYVCRRTFRDGTPEDQRHGNTWPYCPDDWLTKLGLWFRRWRKGAPRVMGDGAKAINGIAAERDQLQARLDAALAVVEAADGMHAYAIDYDTEGTKLWREVKAYEAAKRAFDASMAGTHQEGAANAEA